MTPASPRLLLDTCAVIWTANDDAIAEAATAAIDRAGDEGEPIFISPITAWEIGLLVAHNRLTIDTRPEVWFRRIQALPQVELADMPTEVLIESSFLPGEPPRDPADRIIIATAREYGMQIVTRDNIILDYARAGNVRALAC